MGRCNPKSLRLSRTSTSGWRRSGVEIRRVVKEDVNSFVETYIESYKGLEDYAYRTKREIKNYFKWLLKRDSDGFMVAELNGKIVGFVACDANWFSLFELKKVGEIHEIFVLPRFRKMGIGSTLLEMALKYALSKGRDLAELWFGDRNDVAKIFYIKNGFKIAGKVGKWVRMVRKLI
jgi:ribosomal protein S18 acetylase RimI-like enzyme